MTSAQAIVKVTAVLEREHAGELIAKLQEDGVRDIYISAGATPVYHRKAITLPWGSSVAVSFLPREAVRFYVQGDEAERAVERVVSIARLDIPGRGGVFAQPCSLIEKNQACHINQDINGVQGPMRATVTRDLVGICAIIQRGESEPLCRVALDVGAAPLITYGIGTGLRDKLGLLRVTIPAEKEILRLAVSHREKDRVFARLIKAGKLGQPGKGFIFTFPMTCGIIPTVPSGDGFSGPATINQIISAIDSLKGDLDWRAQVETHAGPEQHYQSFSGVNLSLICNNGTGSGLVANAMSAGLGGATIEKWKLVARHEDSPVSPAREECIMTVPQQKLGDIVGNMRQGGAMQDASQGLLINAQAGEAFTYIAKN